MEFLHIIQNPVGLHARPASHLKALIKDWGGVIEIEFKGRKVRADKLLQVVSLGAVTGDTLKIIVHGIDEKNKIEKLRSFFKEEI